ncbi:major facilitator superfamily domain-containing protein [Leptodontidium sp. MPI-SDFR-AT-0119]|nr:major facilitator superfamily domain-containing protein [Leptodontidium sp. MPI-SDFR-AT-0119]
MRIFQRYWSWWSYTHRGTTFRELQSQSDRRAHILDSIEQGPNSESLQTVFVRGHGFGLFASGYALFSINLVIPILGIVYYQGAIPHSYEVALNVVTLGGAIFGHICFGFMTDRYGRRNLGCTSLGIIIAATLGSAMSSTGRGGSMSFIAWLLVWRFVLGIGIGGQTSLSAVICAEFAPTRMRGKLLTQLFVYQPYGHLVACLVALAVVASRRDGILAKVESTNYTSECIKVLDSTWRFMIEVTELSSNGVLNGIERWPRREEVDSRPGSWTNVRESKNRSLLSGAVSDVSLPRPDERPPLNPFLPIPKLRTPTIEDHLDHAGRIYTSRKDMLEYFWHKGNWRTLVATGLSSFYSDLPYYGLLLNIPRISALLWDRTIQASVYDRVMKSCWQSAISAPIGALIGCAITVHTINKLGRRNIQLIGFIGLLFMFIVIGSTFRTLRLVAASRTAVMVILYALSQVFFTFGPATTTYILSAELFPTRVDAQSMAVQERLRLLKSEVLGDRKVQIELQGRARWRGVGFIDLLEILA